MTLDNIKPSLFNKPVLAALGLKAGYTSKIVYAYDDDVYEAVLASLGIKDNEFGMQGNQTRVRYCFTAALKNLERSDYCLCVEGRGKWRLTREGITRSRGLTHLIPRDNKLNFEFVAEVLAKIEGTSENLEEEQSPEPAVAEVIDFPTPPPLEILSAEPETEATVEKINLGEGLTFDFVKPQITDSYIVNLLINNTNCFGSWSNRSNTCVGCSLQAQCQQRQFVMLAELEAELEREVASEQRALQQARQVFPEKIAVEVEIPTPKAEKKNLFDNLFEDIDTTVVAQPPSASNGPLVAPVNLICEACKKTILRNTLCSVVLGSGARHVECL